MNRNTPSNTGTGISLSNGKANSEQHIRMEIINPDHLVCWTFTIFPLESLVESAWRWFKQGTVEATTIGRPRFAFTIIIIPIMKVSYVMASPCVSLWDGWFNKCHVIPSSRYTKTNPSKAVPAVAIGNHVLQKTNSDRGLLQQAARGRGVKSLIERPWFIGVFVNENFNDRTNRKNEYVTQFCETLTLPNHLISCRWLRS